jgi:hypothetical protein
VSYEKDLRAWRWRERLAKFVAWAAPPSVVYIGVSCLLGIHCGLNENKLYTIKDWSDFTLVHPVLALAAVAVTLSVWAVDRKPTAPPKQPKLTPDEEDLLRRFREQRP